MGYDWKKNYCRRQSHNGIKKVTDEWIINKFGNQLLYTYFLSCNRYISSLLFLV